MTIENLKQRYIQHLIALSDHVRGHLNGGDWDKEMWEELGECDATLAALKKEQERLRVILKETDQ